MLRIALAAMLPFRYLQQPSRRRWCTAVVLVAVCTLTLSVAMRYSFCGRAANESVTTAQNHQSWTPGLQRLLNNLRADRRKQRPVKVPIFSYFFNRPDLFLCIVETGVPIAACKPDHPDNKNGHHQDRDPPVDLRSASGKRLILPLTHMRWFDGKRRPEST